MRRLICLAAATLVLLSSAARAQAPVDDPNNPAPFGAPIPDQEFYYHAMLDQLEGRFGVDKSFRWEGEAWAGTDTNRIWLKSEGQTDAKGDVEDGQQELLYDRPIGPYFDLQGGVRLDADSRPGRTWAAVGVEGLAPLFFHVSATGYVSSEGHYAAKLEGDYDLLLTQRLILQPQVELNLYSKDDPRREVGAGLSELDSGLRLRYEFSRKFAPYIGVTYEDGFGDTASYAHASGEHPSALRFAVGLRMWL